MSIQWCRGKIYCTPKTAAMLQIRFPGIRRSYVHQIRMLRPVTSSWSFMERPCLVSASTLIWTTIAIAGHNSSVHPFRTKNEKKQVSILPFRTRCRVGMAGKLSYRCILLSQLDLVVFGCGCLSLFEAGRGPLYGVPCNLITPELKARCRMRW